MSRVAIVGCRPPPDDHPHADAYVRQVVAAANLVESLAEGTVVVSGGALGIDQEAAKAARARGLTVVEHLPDYKALGQKAPLVRNRTIVLDADEVHAFPAPWSRGTWHAMGQARACHRRLTLHTVLRVQTARVSYGGPFRFDVTAKSGGADGAPFAPSYAALRPALAARRAADELRANPLHGGAAALAEAERVEREAWEAYVPRYVEKMRRSARENRAAWEQVLAGDRVVLVCYCTDPARCHRTVLANLLTRFGATYEGEIAA